MSVSMKQVSMVIDSTIFTSPFFLRNWDRWFVQITIAVIPQEGDGGTPSLLKQENGYSKDTHLIRTLIYKYQ